MGTLNDITTIVADDHPIWRKGLAADLSTPFRVVAEAGTATEAITAIKKHEPKLVVCDLHMPEGGGFEVARQCGESTVVVILTASEQEKDLMDAVAAGAAGYLVKSTAPEDLRTALYKAADGEPVFSPSLAALVLGEFRKMAKTATGENPLSDREREVLRLVARGNTYKAIGAELFIADKTVENHVRNILAKLHLSKRQELIRYAVDHNVD